MTTESDRELLELAAKAAGHKVIGFVESYDDFYWYGPSWGLQLEGVNGVWNALEDDGDALRLFLRLPWMCTETSDIGVTVRERGKAGEPTRVLFMCTEWLKDHSGDIRKATRRAIVRAAASIGRGEG